MPHPTTHPRTVADRSRRHVHASPRPPRPAADRRFSAAVVRELPPRRDPFPALGAW